MYARCFLLIFIVIPTYSFSFDHAGAGVIPIFQSKTNETMVLLGREVYGPAAGTYDFFAGGRKGKETVIQTAAREFGEESLIDQSIPGWGAASVVEKLSELPAENIICADLLQTVSGKKVLPAIYYILPMEETVVSRLLKNFFIDLCYQTDFNCIEKDALAVTSWEALKAAFMSEESTVRALVYQGDPGPVIQAVPLRPDMMVDLFPYFTDAVSRIENGMKIYDCSGRKRSDYTDLSWGMSIQQTITYLKHMVFAYSLRIWGSVPRNFHAQ
jgi:8-oxo-dGTP pyrophosphatase MutT (NUDIX family)